MLGGSQPLLGGITPLAGRIHTPLLGRITPSAWRIQSGRIPLCFLEGSTPSAWKDHTSAWRITPSAWKGSHPLLGRITPSDWKGISHPLLGSHSSCSGRISHPPALCDKDQTLLLGRITGKSHPLLEGSPPLWTRTHSAWKDHTLCWEGITPLLGKDHTLCLEGSHASAKDHTLCLGRITPSAWKDSHPLLGRNHTLCLDPHPLLGRITPSAVEGSHPLLGRITPSAWRITPLCLEGSQPSAWEGITPSAWKDHTLCLGRDHAWIKPLLGRGSHPSAWKDHTLCFGRIHTLSWKDHTPLLFSKDHTLPCLEAITHLSCLEGITPLLGGSHPSAWKDHTLLLGRITPSCLESHPLLGRITPSAWKDHHLLDQHPCLEGGKDSTPFCLARNTLCLEGSHPLLGKDHTPLLEGSHPLLGDHTLPAGRITPLLEGSHPLLGKDQGSHSRGRITPLLWNDHALCCLGGSHPLLEGSGFKHLLAVEMDHTSCFGRITRHPLLPGTESTASPASVKDHHPPACGRITHLLLGEDHTHCLGRITPSALEGSAGQDHTLLGTGSHPLLEGSHPSCLRRITPSCFGRITTLWLGRENASALEGSQKDHTLAWKGITPSAGGSHPLCLGVKGSHPPALVKDHPSALGGSHPLLAERHHTLCTPPWEGITTLPASGLRITPSMITPSLLLEGSHPLLASDHTPLAFWKDHTLLLGTRITASALEGITPSLLRKDHTSALEDHPSAWRKIHTLFCLEEDHTLCSWKRSHPCLEDPSQPLLGKDPPSAWEGSHPSCLDHRIHTSALVKDGGSHPFLPWEDHAPSAWKDHTLRVELNRHYTRWVPSSACAVRHCLGFSCGVELSRARSGLGMFEGNTPCSFYHKVIILFLSPFVNLPLSLYLSLSPSPSPLPLSPLPSPSLLSSPSSSPSPSLHPFLPSSQALSSLPHSPLLPPPTPPLLTRPKFTPSFSSLPSPTPPSTHAPLISLLLQ
ncbi:Ice nucleation protein [Penaeus vannamei]|uniref:Ice nucleation protein n=1 Tax=Penaeus vannamei TaxID=6689 RepID=A0A423T762_PENVA|nr:Ice nucleation protein [Penaeus vannamei]